MITRLFNSRSFEELFQTNIFIVKCPINAILRISKSNMNFKFVFRAQGVMGTKRVDMNINSHVLTCDRVYWRETV